MKGGRDTTPPTAKAPPELRRACTTRTSHAAGRNPLSSCYGPKHRHPIRLSHLPRTQSAGPREDTSTFMTTSRSKHPVDPPQRSASTACRHHMCRDLSSQVSCGRWPASTPRDQGLAVPCGAGLEDREGGTTGSEAESSQAEAKAWAPRPSSGSGSWRVVTPRESLLPSRPSQATLSCLPSFATEPTAHPPAPEGLYLFTESPCLPCLSHPTLIPATESSQMGHECQPIPYRGFGTRKI